MTTLPPDQGPDRIFGSKPLEPSGTGPFRPAEGFQSLMEGGAKAPQGGPTPLTGSAAAGATPMGLAQPAPSAVGGAPSMQTLFVQARNAQDNLGTISQQLQWPALKLRRSQTLLLKNKLTNAQSYIRQTTDKLGIAVGPLRIPPGAAPLERFIAYINDGQDQLLKVQQKLKEMAASGTQLNPASMLMITTKMNLAQQEIEYASTLLSRVVESIRQTMNIQL